MAERFLMEEIEVPRENHRLTVRNLKTVTQCRIEYTLHSELQYHHIDLVVGNWNLTDNVSENS